MAKHNASTASTCILESPPGHQVAPRLGPGIASSIALDFASLPLDLPLCLWNCPIASNTASKFASRCNFGGNFLGREANREAMGQVNEANFGASRWAASKSGSSLQNNEAVVGATFEASFRNNKIVFNMFLNDASLKKACRNNCLVDHRCEPIFEAVFGVTRLRANSLPRKKFFPLSP